MDYVKVKGGSISGEHGVGQQKAKYLDYTHSTQMIGVMKAIKGTLDPNGIMNPYKVLPSTF